MITQMKKVQIPYLDIRSMLLSTRASYKLFKSLLWDVQRHVIVQTLSYRKITYHPLRFAFFDILTSMQDVRHVLHLKVAWQLPSLQVYVPVSYVLPVTKMLNCWTGDFHLLWLWCKQNFASSSKNKGRGTWHIFLRTST